jgi:hypothetical protein
MGEGKNKYGDQWNENYNTEQKYFEKILAQCHFFQQTYIRKRPGFQPGLQQRETDGYPCITEGQQRLKKTT